MAKPRVFISSTYKDLKDTRSALDSFIKSIGYESVTNERGNIAYGKDKKLEEYCYKEIQKCDIVINVIGNKYGSQSSNKVDSITQK